MYKTIGDICNKCIKLLGGSELANAMGARRGNNDAMQSKFTKGKRKKITTKGGLQLKGGTMEAETHRLL